MNNKLLKRLENIRDVTNDLSKSQLQYIDLFGSNYKLYLFPEPTRNILDWYDAINCAKILNGDLPTIAELQYLYDNFRNYFSNSPYWSSSTGDDSIFAERLNFNHGFTVVSYKGLTFYFRVVKRVYL